VAKYEANRALLGTLSEISSDNGDAGWVWIAGYGEGESFPWHWEDGSDITLPDDWWHPTTHGDCLRTKPDYYKPLSKGNCDWKSPYACEAYEAVPADTGDEEEEPAGGDTGVHPCDVGNGGCEQVCVKDGDNAVCFCEEGFELAPDDKSCIAIHPCDVGNGGCEQECVKDGDVAVCACEEGFELASDGKSCIAIHPCDIGNGGCGQICVKDGDNAVCACEEGFELGSDGKSCSAIHPCDIGNGGCGQICVKDGDNAVCACEEGFELGSDGKSCSKVHPCDVGNGGCGQICVKDGDNAVCACEEGFELGPDGKSCSEEICIWYERTPQMHAEGAECNIEGQDLETCQDICTAKDCKAIDWNVSSNPWGGCPCWLHMSPPVGLHFHPKVDHYLRTGSGPCSQKPDGAA